MKNTMKILNLSAPAALLPLVMAATGGIACAQKAPAPAAPGQTRAASALEQVTASVETGDEIRFVRPNELNKAVLVLKNTGKTPVRAQLSFGLKERSNASVPLASAGQIEIAAGGEMRQPLTAQQIGPRLGIKYVDWQLSQGGQSASGHASFAVLNPVGVTPGVQEGRFIFGNAGVRGYWPLELKESLIRAATMVGAESLRTGSDWRILQPAPNEYKWAGEDEMVALTAKYGAQVQYLFAYGGAEWTKSPETLLRVAQNKDEKSQWRYPPRLEPWRNWARTLATRYKGQIRYYEIWNEPDIAFFKGTAEQYLELLKAAHQEIKAVDPNAIVLTGGFTSVNHHSYKRDLHELTLREGQPFFDLHAYHRHGAFAQLQQEVDDQLIPLRQKFGVKEPLYFNETAMGREYEREYEMAVEVPKRLAFVWSRGAVGYHYFTIWARKDEASSATNYRMLNHDFSPRPAWVAYNEMSRVLRGRQFSHELKLGAGRWGFAFGGKGDFAGDDANDYALVAWTEDAASADAPTVLNVGAGATARVVDLMGNSTPVPVSAGRLVFNVRREPQYLVIDNAATRPMPQGALLEVERPGAVVPGGAQTLRVRLRNPLDTPQSVRLTWKVPAPLSSSAPLTWEQRIPANGEATATLPISLPVGTQSSTAPQQVTATYSVGDTALRAEAAIPVLTGVRIPAGDFGARPADFSLQSAGDVVNTNDIDPQTMHLTWKGPQDLSARAWLGRGQNALRLRFEVRDDAARQPYAGKEMWQGDSIQMALAVPGQDGSFEIGLARGDNGRSAVHSWSSPRGFKGGEIVSAVKLQTQRQGDLTIYEATLPYAALGLSDEQLKQGVRFSFVVNDLDDAKATAREGYLRLSDGLATQKDTLRFPTVVLD